MTAKWKRYVVGANAAGASAVLAHEATNVKHEPGIFYRVELWCTAESPADNSIPEDRSLASRTREPVTSGTVFRALEIPPDAADRDRHRDVVAKLHAQVGQKHLPSAADYARHPSMHRTSTLDYIVCVKGEIWLMTDVDEVLMRPGDTVVIRGTNHAWSNRSAEPCLLVGVMVDAVTAPAAVASAS